ncbi:hypothetical protein DFP97_112206 [Paenibacillus prosopidis]|uniref:Uncharacterized protein n=1 Tax=Paenibacillus prosopidis TaxID=630520 RepID=A0A368VR05_9BACL|nr:hypothetical protein DFP97_112206 [Paenibacillus prosopidis]
MVMLHYISTFFDRVPSNICLFSKKYYKILGCLDEKIRLPNILDRLITHASTMVKNLLLLKELFYEKNRCRWCRDPKRKE